ncbi:Ferredoxin-fold anticodon-binding domain-containing protein 1, partial [Ophiophagus hannah]
MQHQQARFLLVGEGNFSFSVHLYKERGCDTHIIATCYGSEESISEQAFTKSNVQFLRDKGAEVYFSVNCTKLKEYFLPAMRNFDRIYFNFPHCGKKAGIKKNRELLAMFFCSCADVLAEKGDVHVALCKGQGGTPADQPVREWHNSWQVVEMAAEAGFILSGIEPFDIRDVGGYKCTGYRNQDKSFCIEGAVNHIFTRSVPFLHSQPLICKVELEGEFMSCQIPQMFLDKINRNFLGINSKHPVRTINEKLIDGLGRSFAVQKANSSFPLVFKDPSASPSSDAFWMIPVAKSRPEIKSAASKNDPGTDQDLSWTLGQYYLRPSLLVFLHSIVKQRDFSPQSLLALSGLAFKKCKICVQVPPIFHEALFICALKENGEDAQLLMESLVGMLNSLLPSSDVKLASLNQEPESSEQKTFLPSPELFLLNPKHAVTVSCQGFDSGPKEFHVGTISTVRWQPPSVRQNMACVSLNLDLLAMCACGISDWRMLWTPDERFARQFSGGRLGLFQSFSLHPPTYVHDISFWLPEAETFREVQLHTIARHASLDTVTSVQLLDCFRLPGAAPTTSLCYRLTYRSCDKALSRPQAAAMQMELREELQRCLRVVVRSSGTKAGHVWAPEGSTAFKCLISARFCAALLSNISDCDETFNYWEPMHYLVYGKGFQTWEYSPVYAIRSYAYLAVCKKFGLHVSRLMLAFLILSTGMFCSASETVEEFPAVVLGVPTGVPMVAIDSHHYGKLVVAPLNIILYNVFTPHGPDLYGTEPWSFYFINGFLNFNVAFILALLALPLTCLMESLLQKFRVQNLGRPYWLTLSPMYIWFLIFFSQPHKEERFLYPIYPLICLCGAVGLSALQVRYHGPLDLYPEFHRIATDPTIHTVPEGRPVHICVGKEWYRFPSSFVLPENWQLQFIASEFRGQLPKPFAKGPGATRLIPTDMNDQNQEEPSRYFDLSKCHYLVDLDSPDEAPREPRYAANKEEWITIAYKPFLDSL